MSTSVHYSHSTFLHTLSTSLPALICVLMAANLTGIKCNLKAVLCFYDALVLSVVCVCMPECMYGVLNMCRCLRSPEEVCEIPWDWSYRHWWGGWCGCWEPHSGPLEKLQVLNHPPDHPLALCLFVGVLGDSVLLCRLDWPGTQRSVCIGFPLPMCWY